MLVRRALRAAPETTTHTHTQGRRRERERGLLLALLTRRHRPHPPPASAQRRRAVEAAARGARVAPSSTATEEYKKESSYIPMGSCKLRVVNDPGWATQELPITGTVKRAPRRDSQEVGHLRGQQARYFLAVCIGPAVTSGPRASSASFTHSGGGLGARRRISSECRRRRV